MVLVKLRMLNSLLYFTAFVSLASYSFHSCFFCDCCNLHQTLCSVYNNFFLIVYLLFYFCMELNI